MTPSLAALLLYGSSFAAAPVATPSEPVAAPISDACKHPGIFTALKLVRAYRDNQAYAAEYFEGKEIQVSGRIVHLKKMSDKPEAFQMLLSPDGKFQLVGLTFVFRDEDRCKLSQLYPSQYISVRGTFDRSKYDPETGSMEVIFEKSRLVEDRIRN